MKVIKSWERWILGGRHSTRRAALRRYTSGLILKGETQHVGR